VPPWVRTQAKLLGKEVKRWLLLMKDFVVVGVIVDVVVAVARDAVGAGLTRRASADAVRAAAPAVDGVAAAR
jgi:hypothetical protein